VTSEREQNPIGKRYRPKAGEDNAKLLDEAERRLGVTLTGKVYACGGFGCVAPTTDGRVVKVTRDLAEVRAVNAVKDAEAFQGFARIDTRPQLFDDELEYTDDDSRWFYLREDVTPLKKSDRDIWWISLGLAEISWVTDTQRHYPGPKAPGVVEMIQKKWTKGMERLGEVAPGIASTISALRERGTLLTDLRMDNAGRRKSGEVVLFDAQGVLDDEHDEERRENPDHARPIRAFHTTTREGADAILAHGFRAGSIGDMGSGVYVSLAPTHVRSHGDAVVVVLEVEVPANVLRIKDEGHRAFYKALYPDDFEARYAADRQERNRLAGEVYGTEWTNLLQPQAREAGYAGILDESRRNVVVFDPGDVRVLGVVANPWGGLRRRNPAAPHKRYRPSQETINRGTPAAVRTTAAKLPSAGPWYAGHGQKIGFEKERIGSGNDQLGPGWYFSSDKDNARSYGPVIHQVQIAWKQVYPTPYEPNPGLVRKFLDALPPEQWVLENEENWGKPTWQAVKKQVWGLLHDMPLLLLLTQLPGTLLWYGEQEHRILDVLVEAGYTGFTVPAGSTHLEPTTLPITWAIVWDRDAIQVERHTNPVDTSARWYHGTSEASAMAALARGSLWARETVGRGRTAPLEGRIYMTRDLGTALVYAFGGMMAGNDPWKGERWRGRGAVLEIIPGTECVPDEDWIGLAISEALRRDTNPLHPEVLPVGRVLVREIPRALSDRWSRYDRYKLSEASVQSSMGKAAIRALQKTARGRAVLDTLTTSAPLLACDQTSRVVRGWSFDKQESKRFDPTGANFFDIATPLETELRRANPAKAPRPYFHKDYAHLGTVKPGQKGYLDWGDPQHFRDVVANMVTLWRDAEAGPDLERLLVLTGYMDESPDRPMEQSYDEDFDDDLESEHGTFFEIEDLPAVVGANASPDTVAQVFAAVLEQLSDFEEEDDEFDLVPLGVQIALVTDALEPEQRDRLRLVPVSKESAFAFIEQHHSAFERPNYRGLLYALGAAQGGHLVAVATIVTPAKDFPKRAAACPWDGIVELSRIASDGSVKFASSMLCARAMELLEESGRRGQEGCLFVTYSLATERGSTYTALANRGLRPVSYNRGKKSGGGGSRAKGEARAGEDKIRWEYGPGALPPDWDVLRRTEASPEQIERATLDFADWDRRQAKEREQLARRKAPRAAGTP
jgi:hypothetical protein